MGGCEVGQAAEGTHLFGHFRHPHGVQAEDDTRPGTRLLPVACSCSSSIPSPDLQSVIHTLLPMHGYVNVENQWQDDPVNVSKLLRRCWM